MRDLSLIIHEEHSSVGTTKQWCESRGLTFEILNASHFLKTPPAAHDAKGVIIFGGDMQVWETDAYPWLLIEKAFIASMLKNDQHVLGLCLGAQLLAEQLGAKVTPMKDWEVGWYEVDLNEQQRKLIPLHWHSSEFSIPTGAVRTGSNSYCENQGFRTNAKHIGYQFHCEIDDARFAHALEGWKTSLKGRVQDKEELRRLKLTHMNVLKTWYFSELDKWWQS